jgi:asparagine synthase (glutamine-hydrolysing)
MTQMTERTGPLFGYAGPPPNPTDELQLASYAARLRGRPRTPETRPFAPGVFVEGPGVAMVDDVLVAIEGAAICDSSGLESPPAAAARAVATAYRTEGVRFFEQLHGGFALALIDVKSGTTLLAVDRMGIERLAYCVAGERILFSSSARAVAESPSLSSRLRPQALFDYLLLHMVPSPHSVFEGVNKLRAGTYARFHAGRLTVQSYWQPRFVETRTAGASDLALEIRQGVEAGVAACLPGAQSGAFLSGGLDSSSVSGMLCKVLDRPAPTFSIGFGVDAYNEIEYARLANRRFGTIPHEYEVTADDIVTAFPQIAAAYDEPFGNSSAVPTFFCAQLARRHGVTHLLAGDGGDEIFGGNERYARQKVFELYHSVPRWVRTRCIEPITRLIDQESRITPLRKLRSYVDQARITMPERLETWNFMYRADLGEMLDPQFRASIDPRAAFRDMAEVYSLSASKSLINKMLFYDWQYTLADNDLRKVGTMCALAGVRVSYPMLHPKLIDVSLRIPPTLKVQGLDLRALYKRAMAGFLPAEIIDKTKHGFGLPFGHWLKTHAPLADMTYSYLSDLKKRRIIRREFLEKLIEDHRSGHPSYFGYAIWDLSMLEAWFQARSVE